LHAPLGCCCKGLQLVWSVACTTGMLLQRAATGVDCRKLQAVHADVTNYFNWDTLMQWL